jgi:hypothetical protein
MVFFGYHGISIRSAIGGHPALELWWLHVSAPDDQAPSRPHAPSDQQTLNRWFNTDAWTITPQYQLGTSPRFPLHGPGINNWDLALMRTFNIHERLRMQFRGEWFNTVNHPQYSNPPGSNATVGSRSFGVITSTTGNGSRVAELALRIFF